MIVSPFVSLLLFILNSVNKFKLILYGLTTLIVFNYYLGFFTYVFQRSYQRTFSWPLNVPYPLQPYAPEIKERWFLPKLLIVPHAVHNSSEPEFSGFSDVPKVEEISLQPRNNYYHNYDLLIMIKSSRRNTERRQALRRTWASSLTPGRRVRAVFLVGKSEAERTMSPDDLSRAYRSHGYELTTLGSGSFQISGPLRSGIETDELEPFFDPELAAEQVSFDDLVLGDFVDHYYNNTLKVLLGLRWFVTLAPDARYLLLIDDDYYLDQSALFRYIDSYVANFSRRASGSADSFIDSDLRSHSTTNSSYTTELNLYAGYVFPNSVPHRVRSSKWFVDLEAYPFDRYPPYVTGGAILLSSDVARKFYELAPFTKPFVFDDVYLSILALKLKIKPIHNPDFVLFPSRNYLVTLKGKIASHGFDDPEYLLKVWGALNEANPDGGSSQNPSSAHFPPTHPRSFSDSRRKKRAP